MRPTPAPGRRSPKRRVPRPWSFIKIKIRNNQALNDARKASVANVTLASGIGTAVLFMVLAFYQFHLTLRPVVQLVGVATKLAAGEPATIKPTRRRDELGQLTSALAAWQRSSQKLVDGLRDGSSKAAASASGLSSASEQLAAATAEQTSATTETSARVEELARTSTAIADTLAHVASQTIETREDRDRPGRIGARTDHGGEPAGVGYSTRNLHCGSQPRRAGFRNGEDVPKRDATGLATNAPADGG